MRPRDAAPLPPPSACPWRRGWARPPPAPKPSHRPSAPDHGGVHTNSGPTNRAFFLCASKVGVQQAIKYWYACLSALVPDSDIAHFSETLVKVSGAHPSVLFCLKGIGIDVARWEEKEQEQKEKTEAGDKGEGRVFELPPMDYDSVLVSKKLLKKLGVDIDQLLSGTVN